MYKVHIDTPEYGQLTWTPPMEIQLRLSLIPDDGAQPTLDSYSVLFGTFIQNLRAIISGGTAERIEDDFVLQLQSLQDFGRASAAHEQVRQWQSEQRRKHGIGGLR